jgi:hypothetical protein
MEAIRELSQVRNKLETQIRTLQSEMEAIDKAIQLVQRETAANNPKSAPDKSFAKVGLTTACREMIGTEWITPFEIREQLLRRGFKTEHKAKLLNAIFATLRRLAKKGEFESQRINDKLRYRRTAAREHSGAA